MSPTSLVHIAALLVAAQQSDPLRGPQLADDATMFVALVETDSAATSPTFQPIRSLVSDDFSDLEFLRELLDGKRIVQLGESGHGMAEAFLLKSRLVRFLHAELGFRVLAFESSIYQCYDAGVRAGNAEARTTLINCPFGVWHTGEVLPLFQYLRETRPSAAPLQLSGFDMQPIGPNKDDRPQFLASIVAPLDPGLAQEIAAIDQEFLAAYDRPSRERRVYFRRHQNRFVSVYARYAAFVAEFREPIAQLHGSVAPVVARQSAVSMAAYVSRQSLPDRVSYAELRDSVMAENLRAIADEAYPGEKIIVWGHNAHLRYGNHRIPVRADSAAGVPARGMGTWLREWYGDRIYTVGVYAFRGNAVGNSRNAYRVGRPAPRSLETRLAARNLRLTFVDLRAVSNGGGEWPTQAVTVRYNGRYEQRLVPLDQYDALMLVATVSPPAFLYE